MRLHVESSSTSLIVSARCSSSSVLAQVVRPATRRRLQQRRPARCGATVPTTQRTLIGAPSPADRLTRSDVAALRVSWKERICSSAARSTLRTSTCAGTDSTTGAKLRMLVTPAATSRSQTSCAADGRRRQHRDRDLLLGHDLGRARRCRARRARGWSCRRGPGRRR